MHLVLDLWDAGQVSLPLIVERSLCRWLELSGVLPHPWCWSMAATTHARMVSKPALIQIRVIESLCNSNSLVRVQSQHLAEQVDRLVSNGRWKCVEGWQWWRLLTSGQHVAFGSLASELHVWQWRRAEEICDQLQLLNWRLRLEENSSTEKLSKNAANAPHVHGSCVMLGSHEDFRSSVILSDNLLGHVPWLVWFLNPK